MRLTQRQREEVRNIVRSGIREVYRNHADRRSDPGRPDRYPAGDPRKAI